MDAERTRVWRFSGLLVLAAMLWLLAWYLDTALSVVAIWERSDTFAHGYLIVPISAWLIWRQRREVLALEPRPSFVALPALAAAGFGWLLAQLATVNVALQYALVSMIPLLVWVILGDRIVRALAFPLAYLLLAVPVGDFLQQMLMEHTADFLVLALKATGIPVYREGLFITIPSGNWSVVEACSGLRYLIASMTLGILYAYLTYRSLGRRAAFVLASLVVPIIANWLRAYMIVMIGHLSGMKYAVGVDHLVYGWLFFGIVMLALFWVGSFWRQDTDQIDTAPAARSDVVSGRSSLASLLAATVAAAAVAAFWPLLATSYGPASPVASPVLRAPQSAGDWLPSGQRVTDWEPRFSSPRAYLKLAYVEAGQNVGLYIGYYRHQWSDSQLISSQNALVSAGGSEWASAGEAMRAVSVAGDSLRLIESALMNRHGRLLVWRVYWVDGRYTSNPYWAKMLQAKSQLSGSGDDGAVIMVYTAFDSDRERAAGILRKYLDSMLPAITRSLSDARAGPK